MEKRILLSILTIIIFIVVMSFFYLSISFVKLEYDYHCWSAHERSGYLFFGLLFSMIPISAMWIYSEIGS
jgi:hypothetical protein